MLLLNTSTLDVEEFGNGEIPPYAILSHTWGDQELTLADMRGPREVAKTKRGFAKIENSCAVAAADGFDYIWNDTCCINKASSAELSEALNSMYRYYQEAEVCYAYLEDVEAKHSPFSPAMEDYPELAKSRWFTRGWTLQELIAPTIVVFFDKGWKEIGTKSSLREAVSQITGIPTEVLLGELDVSTASVAQRMSWAATRQTSRMEDQAYCLMGLFGINMPLLYGEGEKAFLRLQEEIMKVSSDYSLFAWRSGGPAEVHDDGGILAKSARAFLRSRDIVPYNPLNTFDGFLTVNNTGIQLRLHVMGTESEGVGLGLLPCREQGQYGYFIGIYLVDSNLSLKNFKRARADTFELVNLQDFNPLLYPLRSVHVERDTPGRGQGLMGIGSNILSGNLTELCVVKLPEEKRFKLEGRIHFQSNSEWRHDSGHILTRVPYRNGNFAGLVLFSRSGACGLLRFERKGGSIVARCPSSQGRFWTANANVAAIGDRMRLPLGSQGLLVSVALRRRILSLNHHGTRVKCPTYVFEVDFPSSAQNDNIESVVLLGRDPDEDALGFPISYAAGSGISSVVRTLLSRMDERQHKHFAQVEAMHLAAQEGHGEVVELLLQAGVDPDSQHGSCPSALQCAVLKGEFAICKLLISISGVKINLADLNGRTPLSYAAEKGYEAIVKLFLKRKDVLADLADKDGVPPLSYAAREGHRAIVDLLLSRQDVRSNPKTAMASRPLSYAARGGRVDIVKLLLEKRNHGFDGPAGTKGLPDSQTALSHAAAAGHDEVVELLLARSDIMINAKDGQNMTALAHAASNGREGVVKLLLSRYHPEQILQKQDGQTTLLMYAAQGGNANVMKMLLDREPHAFHIKDGSGQNALFYAVRWKRKEAVAMLLAQEGVEAFLADNDGHTPLSYGIESGNDGVVRLLIDHPSVRATLTDKQSQTHLFQAARKGTVSAVDLLLRRQGVLVNSRTVEGYTPLAIAARHNSIGVAWLLLLRDDVEVDLPDLESQKTPLIVAASRGHENMVKLLLDTGKVNTNHRDINGKTALMSAAEQGHTAVVKLLLDRGMGGVTLKDKQGQTALFLAVDNAHEQVVELLLSSGKIDINTLNLDKDSRTALSRATETGNEALVARLLDQGKANPNIRDGADQRTPLSRAAERGYEPIVTRLLDHGKASSEIPDVNGRTPLSWAAANRHTSIIEKLLATGADPNIPSIDGNTPLHWAVLGKSEPTIRQLCGNERVNPCVQNRAGDTPIFLAVKAELVSIVRLLLEKGGFGSKAQDASGRTLLSYAAEAGNVPIMDMILDAVGNDQEYVELQDYKHAQFNSGWPPLVYATVSGRTEAVQRLLKIATNDTRKRFGAENSTVLELAVDRGTPDVVKFVLESGIQFTQREMDRCNWLTQSQRVTSSGIAKVLEDWKAKEKARKRNDRLRVIGLGRRSIETVKSLDSSNGSNQ